MVDAVSASLLARGRSGDQAAQGELLAQCRNYLRVLARTQIDKYLRVRCDDSDLVQETLVEDFRDFPGFAGTTEKELLAGNGPTLPTHRRRPVKRANTYALTCHCVPHRHVF